MSKPSDTIESREPRYGDYYERSELKERIVEAFSEGRNWMGLEPDARNSLMMIADKLSRILNGDADDPDSWHDIGGYAGLIEKRLNDDWSRRMNEAVDAACEAMSEVYGDWIFGGPTRRWPDPAPEASTRCPYFTGTPPSWDNAPEWANWLAQDYNGSFVWSGKYPRLLEDYRWWSGREGFVTVVREGPVNPNWNRAIESRPETHK